MLEKPKGFDCAGLELAGLWAVEKVRTSLKVLVGCEGAWGAGGTEAGGGAVFSKTWDNGIQESKPGACASCESEIWPAWICAKTSSRVNGPTGTFDELRMVMFFSIASGSVWFR